MSGQDPAAAVRVRGWRHVPALDGLRAFAIGAVLVFHTWPSILPGGWLGVDVFFVLSGYLITGLLVAERERTGRIALRAFYRRRAFRLFPALGAAMVLALFLAAVAHRDMETATEREAVAAALYVANWAAILPSVGSGLLKHTWSLSIEEQFYLVWPLLLWGLLRLGGRRTALWVTLAGIAAVAVHRVDVNAQAAFYRTDTRADGLLVGCAIALALGGGSLRRVPAGILRAAAAGGAAILVAIAATDAPGLGFAIGYTVVALAAGALVAPVAVHQLPTLSRLLSWQPLIAAGRRSYGAYLYHYPLYHGLVEPRLGEGPGALLLTASLTLVAAAVSYRYVEAPFLRRKSRAGIQRELVAAA
jgi:peptidoglycan/LPS O-acetylase OafA/YrhL